MQKTEKHCKNQCFCYHKTTKISPKTGPKTQKSAPGPATCGTAKKDVANQKIEVKKLKNTEFFHFSLADFGRARSRTGVFRTVFYSVFWRRASRPIKNKRFWPKNGTPPPGKPVTFYECHPDDHAPAPSVRADFWTFLGSESEILTRQERLFEVRYFAPPVKDWTKFRKDWTHALKTVQRRLSSRSFW